MNTSTYLVLFLAFYSSMSILFLSKRNKQKEEQKQEQKEELK